MGHKPKSRPSFGKHVKGLCQKCWQLCLRANQLSCTFHGLPSNAEECGEFRGTDKTCECGKRLYFEELVMPHPYKRGGPGFPSGHYFCEECGAIHRSPTGDTRYAEWVESLMEHNAGVRCNQRHTKEAI